MSSKDLKIGTHPGPGFAATGNRLALA